MNTVLAKAAKQKIIDNINAINNTNYSIKDISTIRFTVRIIIIWMKDESKFIYEYNINF